MAAVLGVSGSNGNFLIEAAVSTWLPDDRALAIPGGIVRGGDFVGFWAADG